MDDWDTWTIGTRGRLGHVDDWDTGTCWDTCTIGTRGTRGTCWDTWDTWDTWDAWDAWDTWRLRIKRVLLHNHIILHTVIIRQLRHDNLVLIRRRGQRGQLRCQ